MDTFDSLAAELVELTRRVEQAQTAACPPFEGTTFTGRDEREDDLRALRNFIALEPFAHPEHLPPFPRWTPRRRVAPRRTPPRGIPYPRRPTDAT